MLTLLGKRSGQGAGPLRGILPQCSRIRTSERCDNPSSLIFMIAFVSALSSTAEQFGKLDTRRLYTGYRHVSQKYATRHYSGNLVDFGMEEKSTRA